MTVVCGNHEDDEGCYRCCNKCNYDLHSCPGCGEPLDHKDSACAECMELR